MKQFNMEVSYLLAALAFTFFFNGSIAILEEESKRCSEISHDMTKLGECVCNKSSGHIDIINCTDMKMTSDDGLRTELPAEIRKLIFVGNNVPLLDSNLFGNNKSYNAFTFLNLSHNNIAHIKGQAFHKVGSVEELDLSYNNWTLYDEVRVFSNFHNLKTLRLKSAFKEMYNSSHRNVPTLRHIFNASSLKKVEFLDLSNNSFFFLPMDFTEYLPSLKILHLENNDLLDINLHPNFVKNLEELYLQGNEITSLSHNSIDQLGNMTNLKKLVLSGNPWACDCNLQRTIEFLKGNNSLFIDEEQRKQMTCSQPRSLKGKQIGLLHPNELSPCKPYSGMSSSLRASYIIMGVVFGIIGVLFVVIMYLNREKIKSRFIQYSEPIREMIFGHGSSRGYSSVNI